MTSWPRIAQPASSLHSLDGVDRASWAEMEIGVEGDPLGAPAYHPHLLLLSLREALTW